MPIMLGLVEKCFPDRMDAWRPKLVAMVPTYGLAALRRSEARGQHHGRDRQGAGNSALTATRRAFSARVDP